MWQYYLEWATLPQNICVHDQASLVVTGIWQEEIDHEIQIRTQQYTCGDTNAQKDFDRFTGKNTTGNACLEKGRRWRAKHPDKVKTCKNKLGRIYEEKKKPWPKMKQKIFVTLESITLNGKLRLPLFLPMESSIFLFISIKLEYVSPLLISIFFLPLLIVFLLLVGTGLRLPLHFFHVSILFFRFIYFH